MKRIILGAAACALLAGQASAAWRTEFAAEDRVRAEMKEDFDFKDSAEDDGWNIYQRLRFGVKAVSGDYEAYAEGMDLRVGSVKAPKSAQSDDLDLHQAYFAVKKLFGAPLGLKLGRQELKYGKGRLVWAATWGNKINHFDAAVLKYKSGPVTADAFYGEKVGTDVNGWNEPNPNEVLAGAYATFRKSKDGPLVDAYFLANYDGDNIRALNRRTVGARAAFRLPWEVDMEVELPYQFGRESGKDVSAYALHASAGRDLPLPWKPRLAAAYNYASGDKRAADAENNTFKPAYQSPHAPYGLMDLFRWQNMREFALEVSARPAKPVKFIAGTNLFWLASTGDFWYNSSGGKVRSAVNTAAGSYVGQEVSLVAECDLGGGLLGEAGYAHFYSGDYVKDTGRATNSMDDADWLYVQLNFKFKGGK